MPKFLIPTLFAALAAFIFTAGGATAASLITGAKIKDNTITGRDVRNRSLDAGDLRPRTVARFSNLNARTKAEVDQVLGESVTDTTTTVRALCPVGQVATGGGGGIIGEPKRGDLRSSVPVSAGEGLPPIGWEITIQDNGSRPTDAPLPVARAYAVCAP